MLATLKKNFHKVIARALTKETKKLLKANPDLTIVAVTGSVGKTTTKLACAQILSKKFRIRVHSGNYNTDIGVPLSVFGLAQPDKLLQPIKWLKIWLAMRRERRKPFPYEILILEFGADQAGEIGYFMDYINPDIGIVTAVQPVHIEGFKSIEVIREEKLKLAKGSKAALLNGDDTYLMEGSSEIQTPVYTFGLQGGDFYFEEKSFEEKGGFSGIMHLKNESFETTVPYLARHLLRSAVAAAAVGVLLGMESSQVIETVATLTPTNGRINPLSGKNGSLVLDDSYNSSPQAALEALSTLHSLSGRKIAVLGSMNELGDYAKKGHEKVGAHCGELDLLVTVGDHSHEWLAPAAKAAGLRDDQIKSFSSPYEAGNYLAPLLKAGDKVLVKGSQNKVFTEEVTKILLANPDDARNLVRQSKRWLDVKSKAFI